MRPLRDFFLAPAAWLLAGTLAFAGRVAVGLPQQAGGCGVDWIATFPFTEGREGL
jgi:hypothetical protein